MVNKVVNRIEAKSILNKQKKRDSWFLVDYSVNPYQGCPFGCIYCYTRGSKYGTHLARTLSVKVNAPELLDRQLSRRAEKKEYGIIAFASQEAYPPIEEELGVTRTLLEICLKHRFPVFIGTKSTLVVRDLDILREIDRNALLPDDLKPRLNRGAIVSVSLSTVDERLARIFEPGAPTPMERLETMGRCQKEGFLTGVNFIPVLPFLSDSDERLEEMIKAASDLRAGFVLVGGLTLFGEGPTDCRTLYFKALEVHFPELVPKYQDLFGGSFGPPWRYQKVLERRAKALCERYGVIYGIA